MRFTDQDPKTGPKLITQQRYQQLQKQAEAIDWTIARLCERIRDRWQGPNDMLRPVFPIRLGQLTIDEAGFVQAEIQALTPDHWHPCDYDPRHKSPCFDTPKECKNRKRDSAYTCLPCLTLENEKHRRKAAEKRQAAG